MVSLLAIKRHELPGSRLNDRLLAEARAGLRVVHRHKLWRLILTSAGANLGRGLALELFILFAYRGLRLSPGVVGAVLAAGAAATLAGAALSTRIAARLGLGRTLVLSSVLKGLPWLGTPLALIYPPIPIMAAIMAASSLFLPVWNVNNVSLRRYLTDPDLPGRVSATARTISWAAIPLSAFLGGVRAQVGTVRWGDRHGLAIVLVAGGLIWTAATLALPVGLAAVSRRRQESRQRGRAWMVRAFSAASKGARSEDPAAGLAL